MKKEWRASRPPGYFADKNRRWRKNNPEKAAAYGRSEKAKAAARRYRQKYTEFIHSVKMKYGCMNPKCCWQGELPGYALDFHHVDSGDKNFNLACPPGFNKLRIAEEINKCVILCAVCHRMHTHGDLDVSNLTRCCIEEGEQNGR